MTIESIRDKMDFHESYTAIKDGREVADLRVYVTKRRGTYGYQFAAILWDSSNKNESLSYSSSRTGGCGYNKINACTSEVFRARGEVGVAYEWGGEIHKTTLADYCNGFGPAYTMEKAFPGCYIHYAHN